MPILGTLIDRTTVSRAGDAGTTQQNVQLNTLAHSLPATNPDTVFVNLRSVQAIGAIPVVLVRPFGMGGNASLQTYGYEFLPGPSGISAPTLLFDVVAINFHSVIR